MTGEQKQQIYILRKKGVSFADIAQRLDIPRNTVKTFCWRGGLTDAEMKKPQANLGYRGFCKMCGVALEQKSKSRPKLFCCDKCRSAWWSLNPQQLNRKSLLTLCCPVCGGEFSCYPSQKKQFCSHECYIVNRYYKGKSDENTD